jgi:hypothetical protein
VTARKNVSARLEADYLTEGMRPVDHVRPLPPSVVGRGKDEMTQDEIDALYPVAFEDTLTARLAEDGEVPL